MQATLRLGGSSVTRGLPRRPRPPSLAALSSAWADPTPCSHNRFASTSATVPAFGSRHHFGSKAAAASPPVHATPHYMDYDTLVDMHLITRQSFGNRPLFGTQKGGKDSPFEWLTYKEFGKQVDRCRAALAGLGVTRGDTVGIISNNREEWAVCAYATYSLGGVFVPMYEEQVRERYAVYFWECRLFLGIDNLPMRCPRGTKGICLSFGFGLRVCSSLCELTSLTWGVVGKDTLPSSLTSTRD